jgi:hypothetical protein
MPDRIPPITHSDLDRHGFARVLIATAQRTGVAGYPGGEGIPVRAIAQSIGDHLGLPTESIPADRLEQHFGFLAQVIVLDGPVTTLTTRKTLGWAPTHPGLLEDFDKGDYFTAGV